MRKMIRRNLAKAASSQGGFSLTEILIALTLLAIGGTFVAGKIFESFDEGRADAARTQMGGIASALKDYKRHCNSYPTTDQGLDALLSKPEGGKECKRYRQSGYLEAEEVPMDPWDNEYVYESEGRSFTISSFGIDGEEGTDDDIYFGKSKK